MSERYSLQQKEIFQAVINDKIAELEKRPADEAKLQELQFWLRMKNHFADLP